jgi:exodeoxyribonuclease-1
MQAVVGCGHHPKNPTIQALFELRCDTPEVLNLGEEDLAGEIKGPKRVLSQSLTGGFYSGPSWNMLLQ